MKGQTGTDKGDGGQSATSDPILGTGHSSIAKEKDAFKYDTFYKGGSI